jgi:hypothetical protein
MAAHSSLPASMLGCHGHILTCRFKPTSSSTEAELITGGAVKSISRTSAGIYVLTLNDKWSHLLFSAANLVTGFAANPSAQCDAYVAGVSLTGKTVTINTMSGVTNSDFTDAEVDVLLVVDDSTVTE